MVFDDDISISVDMDDKLGLDNLRDCLETIKRHGQVLQVQLANLENGTTLPAQNENITQSAQTLRLSTNAMITSCCEYIETVEEQMKFWEKAFEREREKRHRLEEMVEQLAQQHAKLETAAHHIVSSTDIQITPATESISDVAMHLTLAELIARTSAEEDDEEIAPHGIISEDKRRRSTIPAKPYYPIDLWSIMKKFIGKDIWRISMPVNFNEPISMLQRLAEDYEYAQLLDKAAECSDPGEQLAYVAAFSISSYATTANRTGKPFNPLLGETYEFDRTSDLGWRVIAEQVSHHPPITAIHCEGKAWKSWQDISVTSKFRGKDLHLVPAGVVNVDFASGHKYSWRKVNTTVHNIILGKLWIDHFGDAEIIGKDMAKGHKCRITYHPYSYFSREPHRKINGAITNEANETEWLIRGYWDDKVEIARVRTSPEPSVSDGSSATEEYTTIWTTCPPLKDSENFYNFTLFACQLNEMEEGIAPTDSRLRPDQRLMEEGKWDASNVEKTRLEEKQRSRQRAITAENVMAESEGRSSMYPPYEPLWFTKEQGDDNGDVVYVYKGTYWEHKSNQDWSMCPEIF